MKETALSVFRSPPKFHNCAQAVAEGWRRATGRDGHLVDELTSCGGGRAPGGLCGALHAAHAISQDTHVIEGMNERFSDAIGALNCREIRKLGRASCEECVALAAELLASHQKKSTLKTD